MGEVVKTAGQVGYDSYAEHQHWINDEGNSMPSWIELSHESKAAWECAALAIAKVAWEYAIRVTTEASHAVQN